MNLRTTTLVAVTAIVAACGGQDASDPATTSSSGTGGSTSVGSATGGAAATGAGGSTSGSGGQGAGNTTFDFQGEYFAHIGGSRQDNLRDVAFTADGGLVIVGGTFVAGGSHDIVPGGVTPKVTKTPCTGGNNASGADMDMVVIRLDANGSLQWMSIIGGPHYERAYGVEIAPNGDILLAGRAGACAPTSAGALQPNFGGDNNANVYGQQDGYVARLDANGDLQWSTYFGGNDNAFIRDLAVDSAGNVIIGTFVTAGASYPNWAQTAFSQSFQTTSAGGMDSIVAKIAADGSSVLWASRLGGSQNDGSQPSVRVDPTDDSIVFLTHGRSSDVNQNASTIFSAPPQGKNTNHGNLIKLTKDGAHVFTRYLGASGPVNGDTHNLWVHTDGTIYVADSLCSDSACFSQAGDSPGPLPTLDPATSANAVQPDYAGGGVPPGNPIAGNYPGDGYIVKLSPSGMPLAATLFGGDYGEGIEGVAVTQSGTVVVSGGTTSAALPAPMGGTTGTFLGSLDGFVATLSSDLSEVLHVRYFGSDQDSDAVSVVTGGNRIAVVGATGPQATLHISFTPQTGPAAPLANADLEGTTVLPNIGVQGHEDSWVCVFEQLEVPVP